MIARIAGLLTRLRDQARGATLIEFGLVAPPLMLIIMGIGDLGYQSYLRAVTRGVLERAAREASLGTISSSEVEAFVRREMAPIMTKSGTANVVMKSYYNFSRIGKPEKITKDTVPLGTFNTGDCYEDANNNGSFDTSAGATGLGGPDDVIYYEAQISTPRLFPLAKLLGLSPMQTVNATTMARNQPWANQASPPERCT